MSVNSTARTTSSVVCTRETIRPLYTNILIVGANIPVYSEQLCKNIPLNLRRWMQLNSV